MIDVYVVEDQPEFRDRLYKIIHNMIMIESFDMELKLKTSDPYELLESCKNTQNTGVYFLDVDLGADINGIQLAEKIREYDPRGFIIFVTTHAEMSYLTFKYKVEALDYIIKDNQQEIQSRVHQCLLNVNEKYSASGKDNHKTISIKLSDRQVVVEYDKILFFETSSSAHKVNLHCFDRQIEFYGHLSELEDQLDERFIRCHRSFLVNKNNINELNKQTKVIIMKNGQECYYSTRGARLLKEII